MNGQMMNYKRYHESLANTAEPSNGIPKLKIDYDGLIAYAKEKHVSPNELSDEEKARFVIRKAAVS